MVRSPFSGTPGALSKFEFGGPAVAAIRFFAIANILWPLALLYRLRSPANYRSSYDLLIVAGLLIFYSALVAALSAKVVIIGWSPIFASRDGFFRSTLGRVGPFSRWSDISELELVKFRYGFNNTIRHKILIKDGVKTVVVDDYIKCFDDFAKLLNEQAERYAPPIYYADKVAGAERVRVSRIERRR